MPSMVEILARGPWAEALKKTMIRNGWDQAELARNMRISRSYATRLLLGTRPPTRRVVLEAARFGVPEPMTQKAKKKKGNGK